MRVHHINCGTLCPVCKRLIEGQGGWLESGRMVCHCLLVESRDGLVLVDTGIGRADAARPGRLGGGFDAFARPDWATLVPAADHVERLGFKLTDVRHVVVTHLDLDHAGGIADLEHATLHVAANELDAALKPGNVAHSQRYIRPQIDPIAARLRARPESVRTYHPLEGDRLWDLPAQPLKGLEGIALIPLGGHSPGHCGVAVQGETGWLLHAGDAFFDRAALRRDARRVPAGLRAFERLVADNTAAYFASQAVVADFAAKHSDVQIFCAHDAVQFDAFSAR